jgi:general secretion pathway protein G
MWVIKTFTQREAYVRKERGFTLIELLVVIAILAVLFGLTALALNGVGDNAEATAAQAEADMVQTAIDVYMATNELDAVTTPPAPNGCVKAGPNMDTGTEEYEFGEYLRRTSRFFFTWEGDGTVTAAYEDDSSCSGDGLWNRGD